MKNMKNAFCLLLALLLTGAAYAAGPTLEIAGEVVPADPSTYAVGDVITVEVPESGWVVVNPYGMEVQRDGIVSTDQIVSPVMVMENRSAVPVRVDACAVGTTPEGSEAVFVPVPPLPDAQAKEVFLFLEFQPFLGSSTVWNGLFMDTPNQLPVTGVEKQGVITLEAGGRGALQVSGAAAAAPAAPWTAADTVHVTVSFTFSPADSGEMS